MKSIYSKCNYCPVIASMVSGETSIVADARTSCRSTMIEMTAASAPDVLARNASNLPITPLIHFSSSKVKQDRVARSTIARMSSRAQGQIRSRLRCPISGDSPPAFHGRQIGLSQCREFLRVVSYETLTSRF